MGKRMIGILIVCIFMSGVFGTILYADDKQEFVHQVLTAVLDGENEAFVKVEGYLPEGVELNVQNIGASAASIEQEDNQKCYKIMLELEGEEYELPSNNEAVTVSISSGASDTSDASVTVYDEEESKAEKIAFSEELSKEEVVYETNDLSESIMVESISIITTEATIYSWGQYPQEESGTFQLYYSGSKTITDSTNGLCMSAMHWKCAVLENKIKRGQFNYVCFDVSMSTNSFYGDVYSAIIYLLDDYSVQLGSSWDYDNRYISDTFDSLLPIDSCLAYSDLGLEECVDMRDGRYSDGKYEGVVRLAIPEDTEEFYIALQNCDTVFNIRSIWLEYDDSQKSNYMLDGDKYRNTSDYGTFEYYFGQGRSNSNITRSVSGITMQRYNYKAMCSSKIITSDGVDKIYVQYSLGLSSNRNYCVGLVTLVGDNGVGALPGSSNSYNRYLTGERYSTYDICNPDNPEASSGIIELEIPKGVDSFYLGIENCDTVLTIESVWFSKKDTLDKIISSEFFDLLTEMGGAEKSWKGGSVSVEEIQAMKEVLRTYNIISEESIKFFLATCFTESAYGTRTTEEPNDETAFEEYVSQNGLSYSFSERGAGYIQVTRKSNQDAFLLYDTGSSVKGEELQAEIDAGDHNARVSYIATNCPFSSAAWFWAVVNYTSKDNLNNYVEHYTDESNEELIYLITQYFVNGAYDNVLDALQYAREQLAEGNTVYSIVNETLTVDNYGTYELPNGWNDRIENLKLVNEVLEEMKI